MSARTWQLGDVDPLGAVARAVVGAALPLVWRVSTTGAAHLPAHGPAVLVANHRGLLDGPLLWARVWTARRRPVAFLVKEEMFTGFLGVLLRATGQIPVGRGSGSRALVAAAGVLARGGVVGVFPEGTRGDGAVESVREGAAWLALRTGAPVVPVAMTGTAPADVPPRRGLGLGPLPAARSRLRVDVAPPLTLARAERVRGAASRREGLASASEHVRRAMATHVHDASAATAAAPRPTPTPAERP